MAMKEKTMARYSVATTKDKLSSLIEKALAGEDVVITNRGKPAARIVPADSRSDTDARAATARLRMRVRKTGGGAAPVRRFSDWLYEDKAD
jgi:prevent-host-death family protein